MAKRIRDFCDTIAAIASAPGRGSIGVVRVSGASLLDFALKLSDKRSQPFQSRLATLVTFRDADGNPLDQGVMIYFPAPHSFTGEDVLELQGHGGPIVLQMLLQRCLELGARLAEPGEFSLRAFLNDKMDLAQAEAVADLIDASTKEAARSAVRSLTGEFSKSVHQLVDRLIELRMLVEATLDFSDEEIASDDELRASKMAHRLAQLCGDLTAIQAKARQGSLLRNGLAVVLVGPPNIGKSSLLNCLAGEERAIVTEIAGTTRDAVRETIQIEGIPLHIVDTAGLREANDIVEKLGIERTWREIGKADVIVQLVDARTVWTPADAQIVAQFPVDLAAQRVIVHNKCDLAGLAAGRYEEDDHVHLLLSALTGAGIELLHDELLRIAGWQGQGEDGILARERHLQALTVAKSHLDRATRELNRTELCAEELRLAQDALSTITGEFTSDDLLGEIFSRFCIGK